ncbi:MAG TPA: hypothetical protein VIG61_04510, partial [Fusobacterium sp.]|uniref:hypothetical protein n=1 Tax=Fusobacterium sp. TaxID=68766 RepID=UPI002F40E436
YFFLKRKQKSLIKNFFLILGMLYIAENYVIFIRKKDFRVFISKIPKILLKISYSILHQQYLTKNHLKRAIKIR